MYIVNLVNLVGFLPAFLDAGEITVTSQLRAQVMKFIRSLRQLVESVMHTMRRTGLVIGVFGRRAQAVAGFSMGRVGDHGTCNIVIQLMTSENGIYWYTMVYPIWPIWKNDDQS